MVAGNQRIKNLGLLPRDINRRYDGAEAAHVRGHKAAEAAFRVYPPNADWVNSAQKVYASLSAAIAKQETADSTPTRMWELGEVAR